MPVKLIRGRVQNPVELQDGDRVLELEATCQNGEPFLNRGFCLLGRLCQVADNCPALKLLCECIELTQRVRLGPAIVADVACTFWLVR